MQALSLTQTAGPAALKAFNYFNQPVPPQLNNSFSQAGRGNNNADRVSLSQQGLVYAQNSANPASGNTAAENEAGAATAQETSEKEVKEEASPVKKEASAVKDNNSAARNNNTQNNTEKELTEQEQQQVAELKRRDAEVKAHEQAHLSAAGGLARGGASFDYETGPDGKRYAVGGEVNIDTSRASDDPQANLRKAQQIRRAATAPADPSAQDRSVASEASRMEAQARVELSEQAREKQSQYVSENTPEADFLAQSASQNEKSIQDSYQKIQNASVLQQARPFVDFFI